MNILSSFGFRRISAFFILIAVLVSPFAVLAAETDSISKTPPVIVEDESVRALKERVRELQQLLMSIDELYANLVKIAEKALSDADTAPNLDMQRRYEQLYMQTSIRMGELQKTRSEIAQHLSELESQLETQRREQ